MGLVEAVKHVFCNYANFSGRATRSEYWWFCLFNFFAWIIFMIIGSLFGTIFGDHGFIGGGLGLILYFLYVFAAIIPSLAVTVRRLHDTGRSGWNYFWCFLPIVGAIILLVFLVSPSMPANNQYGAYEA